ncbi:MFS transporter, partial [Frankia sp. Cpl3]|nr:MFS transporter [Frankia sp. Cpl3]
MAFVSPACYALLAGAGRSLEEQGEIMAKKGMVTTAAAIISPSVGGFMAGGLGYDKAFVIFGIIMLLAGLIAVLFLPNEQKAA